MPKPMSYFGLDSIAVSVDAVKRCGICAQTLEPNLNILKDSGSGDRRGGFACSL